MKDRGLKLEKYLILNKYLLNLFGFENFNDLRDRLKILPEGFDNEGRSYFINELIILPSIKIKKEELLQYDENIKTYTDLLSKNRKQSIIWKYFQYLSLLFSEIFFDNYFNNRDWLIQDLNSFLNQFNANNNKNFSPFSERDLKKIAFWMATGSGKTLIMHVNYWQFFRYCNEKYDNILLITPNEGLSKQHYEEMRKSGIPCKLYEGSFENLRTERGEVLIIDIYKLTKEKKGEGVTIDISYFDGKNLVFIDEGHKGQRTEEQTWKKLREEIAKSGFIFEYSATLGQVIGNNSELLEEYAKSTIFDYSYKYFYSDGYGKDFYVYNLKEDAYSDEYRDLLLTADLLSFYEQCLIYEKSKEEAKRLNIEKPLWVFVGSKVSGRGLDSDIVQIIIFLKKILENESALEQNVKIILSGKSGLTDKQGRDIFSQEFRMLKQTDITPRKIYEKLFHGKGSLELYEIKNAEGEIALKTSLSKTYFGLINVGEPADLKKLLKENNVEVKEDKFSPSLFFNLNKESSQINILIGAKKFIEGWDCWRVSTMCLLNMGKGEGPQIIQLFGRGVRLKGRNFSLKREETPTYNTRMLQTLFIFGLNADYIDTFLNSLRQEELEYEEIPLAIRFNKKDNWKNKLYTIRMKEDFDFTENVLILDFDEDTVSDVKIDLRPKITLAHGMETDIARGEEDIAFKFLNKHLQLIDWNEIYLETMRYKIAKGFYNLLIKKEILEKIIKSNKFKLYLAPHQETIACFAEREKLKKYILTILFNYLDKFYRAHEKQRVMENISVYKLNEYDGNLNFGNIILKVPKSLVDEIKKLIENMEKFYNQDIDDIPAIHFDNHLYSPLIGYKKGKELIESMPSKLNKGETKFITDLRNFLKTKRNLLEGKDVFVLRNLPKRGIGFFISVGFYPDFIIWVKQNSHQKMVFVDPKGIRNMGNFNDEKIQFCISYIKEIERKIKDCLKEKKEESNLELFSFILSVSNYDDIKKVFGNRRHTKEEFYEHNIIFMEDSDYLDKLFSKIGIV